MTKRDWIIMIGAVFAAYGKTTGPQNHTTPDRWIKARGWTKKAEAVAWKDRWFPGAQVVRRGSDPTVNPPPGQCPHCSAMPRATCVEGCLARIVRERRAREEARGF